ncbi:MULTISPECIES: AAA family ATPase [unclassified Rhizobium]|uniref:AAA family ATPase n=1 Tax=unclassified Rhizobium TaxID=2613769 RepID=UPI00247A290D|nr:MULTISPECIES: AAA family ATPase [unclassified Rhizobium]MDH7800689.1 adenylate kinase family enzyme [Rhizobium sp. AN70]
MPHYLDRAEDAANIIAVAQRIMVVGCSGGGKSTLSQKLASAFGLRYISMDREVFWLSGWQARPREEQRQRIAVIVTEDRWLMDGSNPSSFDMRLPRTDIVLWVRMPRWLCLWGAISRIIKGYGKARPEMAVGCPERMDLDFLRYIWNFERRHAPIFEQNFKVYGPNVPVFQLKSRKQLRRLLDLLVIED